MVTREEARSIAEGYLAHQDLDGDLRRRGIRDVLALGELGLRRLNIYGNWPPDDC